MLSPTIDQARDSVTDPDISGFSGFDVTTDRIAEQLKQNLKFFHF